MSPDDSISGTSLASPRGSDGDRFGRYRPRTLDTDRIRPRDQSRVERIENSTRRPTLVRAARRADGPDNGARVIERDAERDDRLLALHRVLDDVGREAVKSEADVDLMRDLVRNPLRRPRHLIGIETGECGIGLGAARREGRHDVERTTACIRRLRPRAAVT